MSKAAWILVAAALVVPVFFLSRKQPSEPVSGTCSQTRNERPASRHADDPLPPPLHPIVPQRLGIRTTPPVRDHAENLRRLIKAGEHHAIQTAAFHWFRDEPAAAGGWIRSQPDLASLAPAIGMISHHVSETEGLEPALGWAELIPADELRNHTYHELLALAIRNGKITRNQLDLTGIPENVIADLESGAPLD